MCKSSTSLVDLVSLRGLFWQCKVFKKLVSWHLKILSYILLDHSLLPHLPTSIPLPRPSSGALSPSTTLELSSGQVAFTQSHLAMHDAWKTCAQGRRRTRSPARMVSRHTAQASSVDMSSCSLIWVAGTSHGKSTRGSHDDDNDDDDVKMIDN